MEALGVIIGLLAVAAVLWMAWQILRELAQSVVFFVAGMPLLALKATFYAGPLVFGVGTGLWIWSTRSKETGNCLVVAAAIGGVAWLMHLRSYHCKCLIHRIADGIDRLLNKLP